MLHGGAPRLSQFQRRSAYAKGKLREALQHNPHVPAHVLGKKRMPRLLPSHYGIGSPDEAVLYADLHRSNWQKTEGALEWLKRGLAAASARTD